MVPATGLRHTQILNSLRVVHYDGLVYLGRICVRYSIDYREAFIINGTVLRKKMHYHTLLLQTSCHAHLRMSHKRTKQFMCNWRTPIFFLLKKYSVYIRPFRKEKKCKKEVQRVLWCLHTIEWL